MSDNARRLAELGMSTELAKEVVKQIAAASGGTVEWSDVDGGDDGARAAIATKPEIDALTSASDAADIVAALKAP